jgi:acetyl esterase
MALDPQARRVLDAAAALGAPDLATLTVEEARAAHLETIPQAGPAEEVAAIEERSIPGPHGPIPVRVYRPRPSDVVPALVYFHGGGWVVGSLDAVDSPLRAVANRSGWTIVSVDYRLSPEHKFPVAVDDACAAVEWVRTHGNEIGVDGRYVGAGGDSAGGTLTAAATLALRNTNPPLACQVLIYPVTNFAFDTNSYEEFATGYGLGRDSMRWYWNHYLAQPGDGANELASPLRGADLSGLPRALVITAEYDPLRDEGEAYAGRLRASGVDVTLSRYDGMIHGFWRMGSVIDAAHRAVAEVADFLRTSASDA